MLLLGSLSNDDGNGNENASSKSNFALLLLLRDYSSSFNLYNVGEVSGNLIDRNDVQVKKENEKSPSCAHDLHKTLILVISRCCFADDGKDMYKNI